MSFFAWLVLGALCGLLGHRLWAREGAEVDIAYGISGALVGGVVFDHALESAPMATFSLASLPTALTGAALVLLFTRLFVGRRAP